jgi:hypothetical protein
MGFYWVYWLTLGCNQHNHILFALQRLFVFCGAADEANRLRAKNNFVFKRLAGHVGWDEIKTMTFKGNAPDA